MTRYAIVLEVDSPPALVPYTDFQTLKQRMGIEWAEVAQRWTVGDLGLAMLVDEEGRLKDDPIVNELGTTLCRFMDAPIVGTAAIVADRGEDIEGLTEDEAQNVLGALDTLLDVMLEGGRS